MADPAAPTTPVPPTPVAPATVTVDPTAESQRRLDESEQRRLAAEDRANRALDQLATVAANALAGPLLPPVAPPALPDPHEDPAAFAEAIATRKAAEVEQRLRAEYTREQSGRLVDVRNNMVNAIELQKMQLRANPAGFPGFDNPEVQREIDAVVQRADLRIVAQPGAVAELYYSVMGRRAAKAAAISSAAALAPGGGRATATAPADATPSTPTLNDREKRAAARAGMTESEWVAYRGAGVMTESEFQAAKAARGAA